MNLFLNPSINELQKLLKEADPTPVIHNIVVDGDGEVIIDPELKLPNIDINRFPFRFRLNLSSPQDYFERGSKWLKRVHSYLLAEWETSIQKSLVQ